MADATRSLSSSLRGAFEFVILSAVRVLAVAWLLHAILGLVHHGHLPRRFVVCDLAWMLWPWGIVGPFASLVLIRGSWSRLRGASFVARLLALVLVVACVVDAAAFYRRCSDGDLFVNCLFPLSVWTGLLLLVWAVLVRPRSQPHRGWFAMVASLAFHGVLAIVGVAWVVATTGALDERTEADAAIVFGAGVDGHGRASWTLLDRTKMGSVLATKGYVDWLVLSGGHGIGAPVSEPDAMHEVALDCGVPTERIRLDHAGENTAATVHNAYAMARANGWRRLLWVSHDYHLARIRFFANDPDIESFTVPAYEAHEIPTATWSFWREVAALTAYWISGRS